MGFDEYGFWWIWVLVGMGRSTAKYTQGLPMLFTNGYHGKLHSLLNHRPCKATVILLDQDHMLSQICRNGIFYVQWMLRVKWFNIEYGLKYINACSLSDTLVSTPLSQGPDIGQCPYSSTHTLIMSCTHHQLLIRSCQGPIQALYWNFHDTDCCPINLQLIASSIMIAATRRCKQTLAL